MSSISPNRITLGGAKCRGFVVAVTVAVAAALAGCGGGGGTSSATAGGAGTSTEGRAQEVSTPTPAARQSPDGELLDKVLARQEGAVAAYAEVIPHLSPRFAHMASYFRAQEQEHVDAVVKTLRGIGAPAGTGPEEIEVGELKTDGERLAFLYELEGATIDRAEWDRARLSGADLQGASISGLNLALLADYAGLIVSQSQQHELLREIGVDVRPD